MLSRFDQTQAPSQSRQISETVSGRQVFSGLDFLPYRFLIPGQRSSVDSCFIGETLAFHATQQIICALLIVHADRLAVVVSEIEFSDVTLQVRTGYMVIGSDQSTLKDAEITFYGIGGDFAACVFFLGMMHGGMLRKLAPNLPVHSRLIGHKMRVLGDIGTEHLFDVIAGDLLHVESANIAATLNKGNDLVLMTEATEVRGFRPRGAEVGFVHFNGYSAAPKQIRAAAIFHGFTDTVRHKPRRLEGNSQGAMQLVRADALLARRDQKDGLEPEAHRDMARLENGADLDSKWLTAVITLVRAYAGAFAAHLAIALSSAAMRAYRAAWPDARLYERIRRFLVMEVGLGKEGFSHDVSPVLEKV